MYKQNSQWCSDEFRDAVVDVGDVHADNGYAGSTFVVQSGQVRSDDEEGELLWFGQQQWKAVIDDDGAIVGEHLEGHILADGVILLVVYHFAILVDVLVARVDAADQSSRCLSKEKQLSVWFRLHIILSD